MGKNHVQIHIHFDRDPWSATLQAGQPKCFFGLDTEKGLYLRKMSNDKVDAMDYLFIRPELYR